MNEAEHGMSSETAPPSLLDIGATYKVTKSGSYAHDSPSAVARVSVPTTLPPALMRGTHRKADSWCAQWSSCQSGGRLLAGTAPLPEVQRKRATGGCGKRGVYVSIEPWLINGSSCHGCSVIVMGRESSL